MADQDLASLLAKGERAAFHGPPAQAVEALTKAVDLSGDAGTDERAAATWLLGLSLGACGRYGQAIDILSPVLQAGEGKGAGGAVRLFGSLAASSLGSVRRQLGRHAEAREVDLRGLDLADPTGEARFACQLGLAADAVGLGDSKDAHRAAEASAALLPERPSEWWRQRVRLDWVRAEIALLDEDHEGAIEAAEAAVDRAERARAPRHVAKGLLFLGVAQVQHGHEDGAASLRRAATLAEGLGALPLIWPSRAVLGAVLAGTDDKESDTCLAAARRAVLAIADDLPDGLRTDWLARDDLKALLA